MNVKLSDIETSLQYGKFFTGKLLIFLYFGLSTALLFPIITILMIITTFTVGMDWHKDMLFAMIGCNIFGLSLDIIFMYFIIKNNKLKKKILLWLEDAVRVKAFAEKAGQFRAGRWMADKHVRIKVKFKIEGEKHLKMYMGKGEGFEGMPGYRMVFAKYADKEIDILYSPKYDQVLILKDNTPYDIV